MKRLPVFFLVLLLAACGESKTPPAGPPAPKLTAGATPRETLEAMRACTLARDWKALYALNAPSEIEESEERWATAKLAPENEEELRKQAGRIGRTLDEVRAMSLLEYFVARNARQAEDPKLEEIVRGVEYLSEKEELPGVVMVTFRAGEGSQQAPLKRENGLWYLWKMLTAMSTP